MNACLIWCFALATFMIQGSAFGEPKTKENAKGITIEVSDLEQNPGDPCHLDTFAGRVVKRDFADDAVTLTRITVENSDGVRTGINVEIPPDMNMALRGRVFDGLQRLSKVGRYATGRIYYCGAAGRFLFLDEIK